MSHLITVIILTSDDHQILRHTKQQEENIQ